MAPATDTLIKFLPNWTKCLLAIHVTEDALRPLVKTVVERIHRDAVSYARERSNVQECNRCSADSRPRKWSPLNPCPCNSFCNMMEQRLRQELYNIQTPFWYSVDVSQWTENSWQFAKAFVPPPSGKRISCADDTDLSALTSIAMNCKSFNMDKANKKLFSKGKQIRNNVMHWTSAQDFDVNEMIRSIQGLRAVLLCIPVHSMDDGNRKAAAIKTLDELANVNIDLQLIDVDGVTRTFRKRLQIYLVDLYEKIYRDSPVTSEQFPRTRGTDLRHLYAPPSMLEDNMDFGHEEKSITGYREIFKSAGARRKRIYITGDAGHGKTTFAKRMTLTWTKTISDNINNDLEVTSDDEEVMRQFDYLFFVSLRYVDRSVISMLDMIKTQLFDEMKMFHQLVQNVLQEYPEKCLVILDGLDEWTPPKEASSSPLYPFGVPRYHPSNAYTVITLTRPWKLEKLCLDRAFIDQQIKLVGFDDKAAYQFTENLVAKLNDIFKKNKLTDDFHRLIKRRNLSHFKTIPIVLKELICCWYDNKEIGSSKCQIFSNVLETFLNISEQKYRSIFQESRSLKQGKSFPDLPMCIKCKSKCNKFISLLLSLGKLAFDTLLSEDRENALVFEHDSDLFHLSKEEEQLSFDTGILTANEIIKAASSQHRYISFFHKTIQDFLAALYIGISGTSEFMHPRLAEICEGNRYDTVDIVQELYDVFVFLCGIDAKTAASISDWLTRILSSTPRTQVYKKCCDNHLDNQARHDNTVEVKLLNKLAIDCMSEADASGTEMVFHLTDIFIDTTTLPEHECQIYRKLVSKNYFDITSIYLRSRTPLPDDLIEELMTATRLERLHIECDQPSAKYATLVNQLVNESVMTLQSLTLSRFDDATEIALLPIQADKQSEKYSNASGCTCGTLTSLTRLTAVSLGFKNLDRDDMINLFSQLQTMKTLKEITIRCLKRSETGKAEMNTRERRQTRIPSEEILDVDFSGHELNVLILWRLPLTRLKISAPSLKTLSLLYLTGTGQNMPTVTYVNKFANLQQLETDIPLRILQGSDSGPSLLQAMQECTHLSHLTLYDADLSAGLVLPASMAQLKSIYFNNVSMTRDSFQDFVYSIDRRPRHRIEVEFLWLTLKTKTPATASSDMVEILDALSDLVELKWKREHNTHGLDIRFSFEFFIRAKYSCA